MIFRFTAIVALSGLMAGTSGPAAAGDLTLVIQNGRVNLTAQDVSARQILAEWARVGQTRILNGDRVAGPPLTLQLNGVPEREALDIILRSASGYMAVARPSGNSGASMFDRILVMVSSSAPPLAHITPGPSRMPNRPLPVQDGVEPVDEDENALMDQPSDEAADPNGPAGGAQPGNPYGRGGFPAVFPGPNRPFPNNPNNVNIPALTTDEPPVPQPAVPANPWNIGAGSSLPGVISQPQQPPNPTSPNPPEGSI